MYTTSKTSLSYMSCTDVTKISPEPNPDDQIRSASRSLNAATQKAPLKPSRLGWNTLIDITHEHQNISSALTQSVGEN